jgi:putative FmdB family regulatory protein
MPTYEYACPTCGIVEVFQSIKEPALTRCPTCKKAKVQRMVSLGGGVIFKGSGFWETDYNRSSDYQAKRKAEDAAPAAPGKDAAAPAAPATKADVPEPKPGAQAKPAAKSAPAAKPKAEVPAGKSASAIRPPRAS